MNPEERARANIDSQLEECGWRVQNRSEINISAARGVAVREFSMPGAGEADYLLYANGRAIGVVEAKPEGWTLKGVEPQSGGYMRGLPLGVPPLHLRGDHAPRRRPTREDVQMGPKVNEPELEKVEALVKGAVDQGPKSSSAAGALTERCSRGVTGSSRRC